MKNKLKLKLKKRELLELTKEIHFLAEERMDFSTRMELSKNRDSIEKVADVVKAHIFSLQVKDETNPEMMSKDSAKAIGVFVEGEIEVDYFPLDVDTIDVDSIDTGKPYFFIFKLFG